MRAVRQPEVKSHRELQCGAPVLIIQLNKFISLTFDYNFGAGQKDLLFGILFNYYADDESLNDS